VRYTDDNEEIVDEVVTKKKKEKRFLSIHKSFNENPLDTLYEAEEYNQDFKILEKEVPKLYYSKNNSRIVYDTNSVEDTLQRSFNAPSLKFDILTEQNNKVIAEDNNENNCEIFELKSKELKRSSSNKLIDSFMDKSEK